jgi:hypothetical protein
MRRCLVDDATGWWWCWWPMRYPVISAFNIIFVAFGITALARSVAHIRTFGSCGLAACGGGRGAEPDHRDIGGNLYFHRLRYDPHSPLAVFLSALSERILPEQQLDRLDLGAILNQGIHAFGVGPGGDQLSQYDARAPSAPWRTTALLI